MKRQIGLFHHTYFVEAKPDEDMTLLDDAAACGAIEARAYTPGSMYARIFAESSHYLLGSIDWEPDQGIAALQRQIGALDSTAPWLPIPENAPNPLAYHRRRIAVVGEAVYVEAAVDEAARIEHRLGSQTRIEVGPPDLFQAGGLPAYVRGTIEWRPDESIQVLIERVEHLVASTTVAMTPEASAPLSS